MRSVASAYVLLVCAVLLNGCTSMTPPASRHSERGVLICNGNGAYTTCRRVSASQAEARLREVRTQVGSRIPR
jgi:hypothetical protein